MSISVAILDDRQLFREGMRLADRDAGRTSASTAKRVAPPEGYELVARRQPDVCMVGAGARRDRRHPATRELVRRIPALRVVVASAAGNADGARAALAAGARGYILKSQASGDLFSAVRTVARGEVYLPRDAGDGAERVARERRRRRSRERRSGQLERARASGVRAVGSRPHERVDWASLLGISAKTVDTHRTKVLRKIGVHSIVDLVRFAARNQLPLD